MDQGLNDHEILLDVDVRAKDPANSSEFLRILRELNTRIAITGENIEGNVCYLDGTAAADYSVSVPTDDLNHAKKRANLYTLSLRHRSMIEVGLNGGHSALICLLANPNLHFFSIDIVGHEYTRHAAAYLKQRFGRRFYFLEGDSRDILPRLAVERPRLKFDLLHVDGGHGAQLAFTDISNCLRLATKGAELIFDDVNAPHLNDVLENFIEMGYLAPRSAVSDLFETVLHEILEIC